jgi:arylsulfatase A-like enzyme/Flp pilus assembly protein TadD
MIIGLGPNLTPFGGGQYNRPVRRTILLILSLGLANILPGCDGEKGEKNPLAHHNVLLITLDTTRADRLGCYGYANAKTPALDALAARGFLFEDAVAQVPLTLPSHGTIMTGRFPKEFGVRINNQGAIGSTHPTLASIFKEHGYRTAAFVATFVLDARFGLNRGFDVYDDDMINVSMQTQPLEWEQPANIIADRALAWLDADKSKPFFAWLHFYDPHDPYTPPPPFPKTYEGEMAFMDTQIKRVTDWLDRSGQRDRTLVVVVGDHGESFGEHGENGHGMFLYQTSLHIPLLFAHPSLTAKSGRIGNTVGAIDVFPTLLDLFGWTKPEGLLSVSLTEAIRTGQSKPRDVYSESDYVWHSYGWAQQRSFTNPDWKFISSTHRELYDRKKDAGEKSNLFDAQKTVAVEISNKLAKFYEDMILAEAQRLPPSAEAAKAIETLGYVQAGRNTRDEFLTESAADPKDKLNVVVDFKAGRKLMKQEKYDEAAALFKSAGEEAPDALAIHAAHGTALVNAKRYEEALDVLENKARKLDAHHQPVLMNIGDAYFMLNRLDEAKNAFIVAVDNDPLDPTAHYKLGKTLLALQKPAEAQTEFAEAVRLFPDFPDAHFELATLLADANQYPQAIEHFQHTVRLKSDHQLARYNLGRALLMVGRNAEAADHLREATRLNPQQGAAWINLGIALLRSGKADDGKDALNRATQFPESAVEAYLNLAIASLRENDREGAKQYYERILRIAPGHPEATRELQRLQSGP